MQILSDVIEIKLAETPTREHIENYILSNYGDIIRWAIIETKANSIKLCITYEKPASK